MDCVDGNGVIICEPLIRVGYASKKYSENSAKFLMRQHFLSQDMKNCRIIKRTH